MEERKNGKILILSIYVDNTLIEPQDLDWIKEIKLKLVKSFKIKDLGKRERQSTVLG